MSRTVKSRKVQNRSNTSVRNNKSTRTARPSARVARIENAKFLDTKVVAGIVRVVGQRGWQGSMTELTQVLSRRVGQSVASVLPSNPRGMRSTVDRVVRALRRAGIKTTFGRTPDHNRKRFVSFSR